MCILYPWPVSGLVSDTVMSSLRLPSPPETAVWPAAWPGAYRAQNVAAEPGAECSDVAAVSSSDSPRSVGAATREKNSPGQAKCKVDGCAPGRLDGSRMRHKAMEFDTLTFNGFCCQCRCHDTNSLDTPYTGVYSAITARSIHRLTHRMRRGHTSHCIANDAFSRSGGRIVQPYLGGLVE